jgi:hypothetical protein
MSLPNEFHIERAKLARAIDSLMRVVREKIIDSPGVNRELIFTSETSSAFLAHGNDTKETRVDPNDYNATLVAFKGGADIHFDSGEKKSISERNRCLYIPKNIGFTAISNEDKSSILTVVDKFNL